MVEVHETEFADGWLQIKVNDMLSADPLQILTVAHPGEVIYDLLVPWNFEPIPGRQE